MGGSTNVSDASLKSTPEDARTEDCLQMLRQVNARTYSRLDLEPGKSRIGFIAQEVRDAAPPAFGGLIESCSHSNSQGGDGREILTLDYARLSAVLWQSCRSLLARVEALVAIQTQCCLMKRNEHDDEDDVSDTERTEEGAQETKVQALCALPWNGGRHGNPLPGAPDCLSAQVPRSLSDATTIVPNQRRV